MKQLMAAALGVVLLVGPRASRAQDRSDSTQNFGLKQFALSAGALSAFVLAADAMTARAFHGASSEGTLTTARQFDRFGDPTGLVPIIGGVALAGLITHDRLVDRTALHAVAAVVLASITVQVGKRFMGRDRPYADPDLDGLDFLHFGGNPAFPSGHTAAAFALATSLGDAIGNRWASIGLYTLAAGTGWARMAEEQHWLSDVLAGAAVGVLSAKFVTGRVRLFGIRAPRVIVGPRSAGFSWGF